MVALNAATILCERDGGEIYVHSLRVFAKAAYEAFVADVFIVVRGGV